MSKKTPSRPSAILGLVLGLSLAVALAPPAIAAGPFPLLARIADMVKAEYIDPVDDAKLEAGAIDGLFSVTATVSVTATTGLDPGAPASRRPHEAGKMPVLPDAGAAFKAKILKDRRFSALGEALSSLHDRHVAAADQSLEFAAIKGMLATLDDPYTRFLEPAAFKAMNDDRAGAYAGVGMQVGIVDHQLTVIAPFEDSPAQKAGLRAGDRILEIDGEAAADLPVEVAVSRIRGPVGTRVSLKVRRAGRKEPLEATVSRAFIVTKPVKTRELASDIGYVRLTTFYNEEADTQMHLAIEKMRDKRALILDLRGNPGGLLPKAVAIGEMLIGTGPIVQIVDRTGHKEFLPPYPDVPRSPLWPKGKRVVVLVDGGSASASEILAGALKDTGTGTLVGTKTFGKGVVQTIHALEGGGGVAITTDRYLTPSGAYINKVGIAPDIVVEQAKPKDPAQMPTLDERIASGTDAQLNAAVALIGKD